MDELDSLNLANNPSCSKMLLKKGANFPEKEKVLFSTKLIKINRRNKEQPRVHYKIFLN